MHIFAFYCYVRWIYLNCVVKINVIFSETCNIIQNKNIKLPPNC